jgi:hypothetical protein
MKFKRLSMLQKFLFVLVPTLVIGFTAYYFIYTGVIHEKENVRKVLNVQDVPSDNTSENPVSVLNAKDFSNIEDLIRKYHDFYNTSLGWENYESLNEAVQLARAEALIDSLVDIKANNIVDEKDLKHTKQLATIYIETKETDALLFLHRIFHDLDKAVNDYKHKDSFGATYTFGDKGFFEFFGNQLDDIEDYIEKKL